MGGGSGGSVGGGVQVGRFGLVGGGGQATLTSPCPPSNHTITINQTRTFAVTHAKHLIGLNKIRSFRSWLLLPHHCSPFWTPTLTLNPSLG